ATTWKPEFAELDKIRNAKRIYIVQEPGDAGLKFVQRVARDLPAEKVRIIILPVKDPSALHLKNLGKQQRVTTGPLPENFETLSPREMFAALNNRQVDIEESGFDKEWFAAIDAAQPFHIQQADVLAEPEIKEQAEEPLPEFPAMPGIVGELCD